MKIRTFFPPLLILLLSGWHAAAAPGDVDPGFNLTTSSSETDSIITSTILPDGRFLVGGSFTQLNGTPSRMFDRVSASGVLDAAYPAPNLNFDYPVFSPAVLPDGKVLVSTPARNGNTVAEFARLNVDGTVDQSYVGPLTGNVFTLWPQKNGGAIAGGDFTNADKPRYLLRLNATGAVDRTFLPRVDGVNSQVYCLVAQPDGKMIIGGTFTSVGGASRKSLARILPNGNLDITFSPVMNDAEPLVRTLALQPDGKVLVGGRFTSISGAARQGFARLNANGTLDTTFTANVAAPDFATTVNSLALQADGKIVVAGAFATINGVARRGLAMLNADGSVDTGFNAALTDGATAGITMQADGRILVNGQFRVSGSNTLRSARRFTNYPATQELTASSPRRVQWLRGGSSPETGFVTFEISSDLGTTWTGLGDGVRIAGGWELPDLALPAMGQIRARARVSTGYGNGAQGLLETKLTYELQPRIALYDGPDTSSPALTDGQAGVVAFGTARQGTPVTRSFTLSNSGNGDLQLADIRVPAGFSVRNAPLFPKVVEAGTAFVLQLQLDAQLPGPVSGTVVLTSNAVNTAVFDFPVSGLVVTPEIVVRDGADAASPDLVSGQNAAVDYGRSVQGTPGSRSFTISNTGTAPLLLKALTVPAGYTPSLPVLLPGVVEPGGSLTIGIDLTATVPGVYAGGVKVESDDMDEGVFSFPVTGEVFIPAPVVSVRGTATTLNRQTGLREQSLSIANDTTATVPAYLLLIRGLPPGVLVQNASRVRSDGTAEVLIRQPLGPRASFTVLLEYYSTNRQPIVIEPVISVEVVLTPPDNSVAGGTGTLAVERLVALPEGGMLLEFSSTPGRLYEIQYSKDGTSWKASQPTVQAAANRTQWIDQGPPRTDKIPGLDGSRFYRVKDVTP